MMLTIIFWSHKKSEGLTMRMRLGGWKDPWMLSDRIIIDRRFAVFAMVWLIRSSSCPCIRGFRASILPTTRLSSSGRLLVFGPQTRFLRARRSTATTRTTPAVALAAPTAATENSLSDILKDNWKGASASYSSSSEYVTHVLVDCDMIEHKAPTPFTVLGAIQSVLDHQSKALTSVPNPVDAPTSMGFVARGNGVLVFFNWNISSHTT